MYKRVLIGAIADITAVAVFIFSVGLNRKERVKRCFFFFMTLLVCFACSKRQNRYDDEFPNKRQVALNTIEYPDILGISMQILKCDSLILINDFQGDSLIHVYDIKNHQLICKMFAVGNGSGEFISPLKLFLIDNTLYVYSLQTSDLYALPVDKILDSRKNMKSLFRVESRAINLYPLSESISIASGLYYEKHFALIDSVGNVLKEFGEYPTYWSEEAGIPIAARAMFHQTNFLLHPEKRRLLTYSSHVMEIYDILDAQNIVLFKSRLMSRYDYRYHIAGELNYVDKGESTESGIVIAECTSERIYIIYNPNKNRRESKGSHICVYDWDGNPIELLQFDKNVRCLTIDEDAMRVYVIAEDPDDSLMFFDLL